MGKLLSYCLWRLALILLALALLLSTFSCSRIFYNAKIVSHNPTLVRSAYPSGEFLERLHHAFRNEGGLKLIVNLTCRISPNEAEFVTQNQVPLTKMCWSARKVPPKEDWGYLVRVFKNPANYPMLIHCNAGADRTGLAIALWRIEMQGTSPEEALSEMKWFMNIYPLFPEMQNTIVERYQVNSGRLWTLTFYYFLRDALLLPKYTALNIIQELKLRN